MLTSAQVAVVGFVNEYGEFICRNDAHDLFDQGDADGLRPVIQYELDEYDVQVSQDYFLGEPGHADDCYCTNGVVCEECGNDIIEPYTSPDCEKEDE